MHHLNTQGAQASGVEPGVQWLPCTPAATFRHQTPGITAFQRNLLRMAVYQLPRDLGAPTNRPISGYPYTTETDTPRSKVEWDQHLISFLQRGQKTVHLEAGRVVIEPTHFLLLRTGRVLMTEHVVEPGGYASHLLFFSEAFLTDFCARHAVPQLTSEPPAFLVLPYDEFTRHFTKGLEVSGFSEQLLPLQGAELLLYLWKTHGPEVIHFFRSRADGREMRLKRVVDVALSQRLTVEEMAFLCHVSLSTFKREFYRVFQDTPQHWLQTERLRRAAYLLREEDRRPSDVYAEVGFENFSAFIQAFKRQFGTTPKRYQQVNV